MPSAAKTLSEGVHAGCGLGDADGVGDGSGAAVGLAVGLGLAVGTGAGWAAAKVIGPDTASRLRSVAEQPCAQKAAAV